MRIRRHGQRVPLVHTHGHVRDGEAWRHLWGWGEHRDNETTETRIAGGRRRSSKDSVGSRTTSAKTHGCQESCVVHRVQLSLLRPRAVGPMSGRGVPVCPLLRLPGPAPAHTAADCGSRANRSRTSGRTRGQPASAMPQRGPGLVIRATRRCTKAGLPRPRRILKSARVGSLTHINGGRSLENKTKSYRI